MSGVRAVATAVRPSDDGSGGACGSGECQRQGEECQESNREPEEICVPELEELDPKDDGEAPGKVEQGEGGARWRRIGDPRLPTEREVEEHNLTHVPYSSRS